MKYITEEELRGLYKRQAFETFTLTEGVKLTPGGRQFLVDRKIPIIEQGEQKMKKTISIPADDCEGPAQEGSCRDRYTDKNQCLSVYFALLEAIFFKQAMELIEYNEALANQIYDMKCRLESIVSGSNGNRAVPGTCEEMADEPLQCRQKKYAPMRRDVMFAEHGKEAACLHLLRCELQKFSLDNDDIFTIDQKKALIDLMDRLTQLTHTTLGREHYLKDVME